MTRDLKSMLGSLFLPTILVLGMFAVKIFEVTTSTDLTYLGIYPLKLKGLIGILTSPFIHDDWAHLYANTIPFFILSGCMFFFYREIALSAFSMIYLLTGLWVWLGAREAWHIGASGVLYGLTSFIFVSGLLRKDTRLMALSMFVIFIYGSMIWGIFPDFFPTKQISWEAHLWGGVAGVVVAVYYRGFGPQRKLYSWEWGDDETPSWYPPDGGLSELKPPDAEEVKPPPVAPPPLEVHYTYIEKEKENNVN